MYVAVVEYKAAGTDGKIGGYPVERDLCTRTFVVHAESLNQVPKILGQWFRNLESGSEYFDRLPPCSSLYLVESQEIDLSQKVQQVAHTQHSVVLKNDEIINMSIMFAVHGIESERNPTLIWEDGEPRRLEPIFCTPDSPDLTEEYL